MHHLTQTNQHLSVQGAFFQIECNKESLMDSEISSIKYQINLFSLASLFKYVQKKKKKKKKNYSGAMFSRKLVKLM